MATCVYCVAPVTRERGTWVDEGGGDCCAGAGDLVHENGVHTVFDPLAGWGEVCLAVLADEGTAGVCLRCFHHLTQHEET